MEWFDQLLGLSTDRLNVYQMSVRAIIVFFTGLLYIRIAGVRTLGNFSVFDKLTLLIVGSMLGRTIMIGDEPFFAVLAAALVIILLHRIISWITLKSSKMGVVFKGSPVLLVKDGHKSIQAMNKERITDNDLDEALRKAGENDINNVKEAWLERSGEISVIKKDPGATHSYSQ